MFSRSRRGFARELPRHYDLTRDKPTKRGFFTEVPSRVPRHLRNKKFVLSLTFFIFFFTILYFRSGDLTADSDDNAVSYPEIFVELYEQERLMPQHNSSLPFPEGENGRFMWVSNQIWGTSVHFSHSKLMIIVLFRTWLE